MLAPGIVSVFPVVSTLGQALGGVLSPVLSRAPFHTYTRVYLSNAEGGGGERGEEGRGQGRKGDEGRKLEAQ